MEGFEAVDDDRLLSGRIDWIDTEGAEAIARHPLECVGKEYPHYVGSVDSPGPERPGEIHPVFYGCFDWHSAVHSHWCLIRLLRLCEDHPEEEAIRSGIDGRLTPENVDAEVAYFEDNEGFERPYGWGWLLRLAGELYLFDDPQADDWRETLRPLEDRIVELTETEFLDRERPIRVGTHGNSAFAMSCVHDYARSVGDESLERATARTAREFFGSDRDAPVAYEPLGWDFVSPSLVEADLMRRVLDRDEFTTWLAEFLPDVSSPPQDAILEPVAVRSDDGVALHLVGLNLSRAWCMAGVAEHVDDSLAGTLREAAGRHARAGIGGGRSRTTTPVPTGSPRSCCTCSPGTRGESLRPEVVTPLRRSRE